MALVAILGCRGEGDLEPGLLALDDAQRRELYAREETSFVSAFLWKPAVDTSAGTFFDLAPLLLHEGEARVPAGAPAVRWTDSTIGLGEGACRQLTYSWRDQASVQGLRMTLGADGFPAVYEVLADSSGARVIFVSSSLEEAAVAEFGAPLPGRRFTVERPVAEAPGVVVAGTLEPGPMPLGPFVYLSQDEHDVISLICRCMPSRVETVIDTAEYSLEPAGDDRSARSGGPETLLRMPSAFDCG